MSQGPSSPTLPPLVPAFLKISKREINKRFVDLEWQQRNRLAQGLQETDPPSEWARLTSDEITRRNRYINIDPWAGNRVRLRVPEGHNDYINASHMSLTCSKSGMSKRFIATQGPKEESTSHFWRMIWHETQSVGVIVMLTQTREAGREKCFEYFPSLLKDDAPAAASSGPVERESPISAVGASAEVPVIVETPVDYTHPPMTIDPTVTSKTTTTLEPSLDPNPTTASSISHDETKSLNDAYSQSPPESETLSQSPPSPAPGSPPKRHSIHIGSSPPSSPLPSGAADDFHLTVNLQNIHYDAHTRSTVREFQLTSSTTTKTVWHYLFNGWPDFLVPEGEDKAALLELCKITAEKAAEGTEGKDGGNPRVVHCSAGVGRSGTFIALDYLMAELEDGALDGGLVGGEDRIAETVSELRKQRMMMVQGEAQFAFLYEILRELWEQKHGVTVSRSPSRSPSLRDGREGDGV